MKKEKLKCKLLNLFLGTAKEHVTEIEHQIHVMKECYHRILAILPFKCLPNTHIIDVLQFVTFQLTFPVKVDISSQWSHLELVCHHKLDA